MILPVLLFFWMWASLLSKRMKWLEDRELRIIQMLDVVLANQYDEQELQKDDADEIDGVDLQDGFDN